MDKFAYRLIVVGINKGWILYEADIKFYLRDNKPCLFNVNVILAIE
jgi:hypothetical protein